MGAEAQPPPLGWRVCEGGEFGTFGWFRCFNVELQRSECVVLIRVFMKTDT